MTKCVNGMKMVIAVAVAGGVVTSLVPLEARAQDLADYDYENLSFRGMSFYGVQFDLGFLGPGFGLTPGVTYWKSTLAQTEVDQFETRLGEITMDQGGTVPPGGFDLGVIDRSDIVLSMDGQYVWAIPLNLFFSAGVGLSAHFLSGSGQAIDDTFIEDLLGSVSAGFNIHAGLEFPITSRVRINGGSKVEVLGDLNYVELRGGLTFIWGGLAPEEVR